MLGQLQQIDGAVRGVGFLLGSQKPFVGFLVKNWPLALLAGVAMYGRLSERKQKGELNTFNAMSDMALILSPLVGLALLNNLAREEHERALAQGAGVPGQTLPTLQPGA